jgi:hypothetical protein
VAAAAAWIACGGDFFLWQLHDKIEMWKKVNLADSKNLAALDSWATLPDSGGKWEKRKKVCPFNNLALPN